MDGTSGWFAHPWKRLPDSLYARPSAAIFPVGVRSFRCCLCRLGLHALDSSDFDTKCVACHGASKVQAGLRLDFYELLMKGGKDGAVITARNPDQSLLLQRVTLSPSDRHFMPAEGRTPLTADEIAALRAWILAGASPTATSIPGIAVAAEHADLPLQPVGDYSPLMDEILQMQRSEGAKLVAVSARPSDGLILRTIDVASTFDDTQLARFQRFAPFIVEAELGRTAVSDACFDTLKQLHEFACSSSGRHSGYGRALAKLSATLTADLLELEWDQGHE